MTDYYDVLEVPRDASQADIRRAYREKVKEYHPDVSDHPKAAERFQAVTRAEEVLGDEGERDRYDRLGHEGYLRVVEDGVPEDHVDSSGGASDGHGTGRTGDERGRGSGSDRTGGGSGRSKRARSESKGTRGGGSVDQGDGWEATGPSAGSDNPSQRSYSPWSSDDGGDDEDDWWDQQFEDDNPFSEASAGGSTTSSRARSVSSGTSGSTAVGGASGNERKRRQRTRSTGGSASGDGLWGTEVDPDVDPSPDPGVVQRTLDSREGTMFAITLLFIYPVFVYFSVTPALPPAINFVVGAATATVAVFMLTEPGISIIVFGTWSLLSPLVLTFVGLSLLSMGGLLVLGSFWVPLALSFLMALAMPS